MIFSSYQFIFGFLPVALATFLLLCRFRAFRAAMVATIFLSLFFYGFWNPRYLLLIGALILANYGIGLLLFQRRPQARAILGAGIALNLGVLGYFKYTDFLLSTMDGALGLSVPLAHIALPLAISFFTFQKIAFLVDIYQGKIQRLNFLDYCLFVVFYPQLIAGPIVHYRDLKPQFDELKSTGPKFEDVAIGVGYFAIGLFKKVVIADSIAHYATPTFDLAATGTAIPLTTAWVAALAYTFQLYFDFSGYSDMAIGLARMYSIRLPFNFNSPYKSDSIIDFWRRWHITLSNFLRDYLYIPLGGNRRGPVRRYVNLFITMLLGGLWHGAGWTFVLWGALHGLYLSVNHVWRHFTGAADRPEPASGLSRAAGVLLTFLSVMIAWVFFRAANFSAAAIILKGMAGLTAMGPLDTATLARGGFLALLTAIAMGMPNSQQIMERLPALPRRQGLIYAGLGAGAFAAIMLLHAPAEFIYFRF